MKYDFKSVIDRHCHDALCVDCLGEDWTPCTPDEGFDVIPMWIADMCFKTVPTVTDAIIRRLEHPIFGYFRPSAEYFDAIIKWQKERNGAVDIKAEHIGYENGVLGGMLSAMGTFCSRGDSVLVHSPTYMGFTKSLKNNGYNIVSSPLYLDENNIWRMDFEDMERRIVENRIHAAIFCSPHNPTGRVWERWEIECAMEIFKKHDVKVVSDEIWSDIVLYGNKHIPTQLVSEDAKMRTVALYAPSKTFNLAGLVGAYHVIYNDSLRRRVEKESSLSHYNEVNVLSMHALIGAYCEEGEEWVSELRQVIGENIDYACNYIKDNFKGVTTSHPQGTYMVFMDVSEWLREHNMTLDELLPLGWKVGVAWQDGRQHGGVEHIRLNLALPGCCVREAFERMDKYVFNK